MPSGCFVVLCCCWSEDGKNTRILLRHVKPVTFGKEMEKTMLLFFPKKSITVSPLWKLKKETRHPSCSWMPPEFWMVIIQLPLAIGKSQPAHFLCMLSKAFSRVTSTRNTAETHKLQPENMRHWNPASSSPAMLISTILKLQIVFLYEALLQLRSNS